jgi:hypothetical protein
MFFVGLTLFGASVSPWALIAVGMSVWLVYAIRATRS